MIVLKKKDYTLLFVFPKFISRIILETKTTQPTLIYN